MPSHETPMEDPALGPLETGPEIPAEEPGLFTATSFGDLTGADEAPAVEVTLAPGGSFPGVTLQGSPLVVTAEAGVATQVRFPGQAVLRTLVQLLPVVLTALVAVIEILNGLRPDWFGPALGAATMVSLAVARIMANPSVNALLHKLGLGAVPKSVDPGPS